MKHKKKPAMPEITVGQPARFLKIGNSSFPTNLWAKAIYSTAKISAAAMDLDNIEILIIARVGNVSVTCNDPDAKSIDLVNLINIGYDNLRKRGLIRGLEPN